MDKSRLKIIAELEDAPLVFGRLILPHHFNLDVPQFHKEIIQQLQGGNRYHCIVAPRGHAKSTLVTLLFVLHRIVYERCKFVVLCSDSYKQSKLFLESLKYELENNELLRSIYGDFVGEMWGEGEIVTKNGIKVLCRGAGQKVRGLKYLNSRPDLIVVDDLENDELVASSERRVKLASWFFKSLLPSLSDNGLLVYIGTILHYDSLLNKLSRDSDVFSVLRYKAICDDGTPLWSSKYTIEALERIKESFRQQGQLDAFYCEYQNEPITIENADFKKEYFKYYDGGDELHKKLNFFITVDLAISEKETADYTVVMVCGVDNENNIYVIEYERGRFKPNETIDIIFRLAKKWNAIVGIESVAYQKSLMWFIQDEMQRRNEYFPLEELKADREKERRIRGLQPRYVVGKVFHKTWMTDLEVELLQFPKSPHDDLADALAYLPQIAFPSYYKEQLDLREMSSDEIISAMFQKEIELLRMGKKPSGLAL